MSKIIVYFIVFISNLFRSIGLRACRFHPTCAAYSIQAYREFGFIQATWLMVRRLLSCHPFSLGGYDPLPMASHCERTPF